MRVAHIDPFSGASGDMLLGALVDVGVGLDDILDVLRGVAVDGYRVTTESVTRGALAATSVTVHVTPTGVVRTWPNVADLLASARLPDAVRARALATFERLAHAEARVHRRPAEHVHFHELGAVDAIVDVVGTCAGLWLLGLDRVACGPVAQGTGMVRAEHGLLPVPAPAVLELLRGAPIFGTTETGELCTPTGAALLAEWADDWGPMPPLTPDRIGYGAGNADFDRPNVLRLVVGDAQVIGPGLVPAVMLETTLDDLPGELVPAVLDALRAAGASDAWARPVVMKKGRPGVDIVCLAETGRVGALRALLFRETTTLGVRAYAVDKAEAQRSFVDVAVAGHRVRLKVGRVGGEVVNVAPEFSDCAEAARATGLPLKEVYARARAAWTPPGGDS